MITVQRFAVGAICSTIFALSAAGSVFAAAPQRPLYVGWAAADITPPKPVPLVGMLYKRISQAVQDPLTATVLALETKGDDGGKEQAILISCDLCVITRATQGRIRALLKAKLKDFDADKLVISATHTHTAPPTDDMFGETTDVSEDKGVMNAAEYLDFFAERVVAAAAEAWQNRKPGGMSWALGHAVVGHNRRAVYADGKAAMYGGTAVPNFLNIEGYEDHGVELLFFWNQQQELTGMVVNLVCTAQETEGLSKVSADFWHEARAEIKSRFGKDIYVLPQCGAAGDQSPHLLWRQRAEEIMLKRKGVSRRQEIALRIAAAVGEALPAARKDIQNSVIFQHAVARIDLPMMEPDLQPFYQADNAKPVELHIMRLGDVALATNPFELFLDYGVRMKSQSKGVLTLVANLSCQHCGYLPTARAAAGGGYSADRYVVGPEGGQGLVRETVKRINQMWD